MNKTQIIQQLEQNPEHILCALTKDDFKLIKALCGREIAWICCLCKEEVAPETVSYEQKHDDCGGDCVAEPVWRFRIQGLAVEPDPIAYLKSFVEEV